ncbi:autophagy-related protein 11 [Diplogelasinospora grovesii]|uniref:Autophagy-related protein 11 n=1 Tax=Diplogelasinospora grovesii TaxID=303347 RepID=A0AAN6N9V4_9PEZI|nr:autophagy-related protein 11 [Diplogelasinospora grovesii]
MISVHQAEVGPQPAFRKRPAVDPYSTQSPVEFKGCMEMATQVLIAHTGQRLQIDASQFALLDDFKASVARQSSIPVQCIITLTPQGKPLKLQTVQTEREIYVYDNRLTQASSPEASPPAKHELPLPKRYTVSNPPNSIDDTRSVQSWQDLFKTRRAWAMKVVEDCTQMATATHERYGEMDVMLRCLDAAVANLESVIKGLEPKYAELKKWAPTAQADYSTLTTGWERYLSLARSIPISSAMVRFMTGRDISGAKGRPQRPATLEDLVDLETARKAGRLAPTALRKLNSRMAELDKVAMRLFQDAEDLFREFERTVARSSLSHDGESLQLLQDIEAVAKKIDTDYQTTLEYSNSTRDLLQASRIAANHTERLLPSIRNRALEMDEMLRYATQARNGLAAESVEFMRTITEITAGSHSVKSQINAVDQEEELATFDYLRLIQQVPYMYASFVAEAVKRREWLEKVKQDSSTLANEMALFQDEEIKRRRRWHKLVGNAYGPETPTAENNVPGLEVNLLGEEEQWPTMSRRELDDLYALLQKQNAEPELVGDIGKMIAELNNPTRQQSKRMKAFKNGSVHEVALGRSGLLIRGDDDLLRSLQEDKSKLESKLKTAESRVRRLEDLLHRQTQASRPSLGNLFQTPSQQLSDRNESTISVKSPRASDDRRRSSEGTDVLVQRIQQLEADLNAERERSAGFEKDLNAGAELHNDIKGQIEELNSTKKDLLENMEALKREFLEERKSLQDEIKRLQARLEDAEDEIEHFGESRENEKASYDERVRALETEVERLLREKHDEALKSEEQVGFLRTEAHSQRERIQAQEKQLQTAQDKNKDMSKKLGAMSEASETLFKALRDLWEQISPDVAVPDDATELAEGVTSKVADTLAKARNIESDMLLLKSELDSADKASVGLRTEMAVTKEKLLSEEMTSIRLRENLAEEKARVTALEGELAESREQLSQLRVRLADGETGSESLRQRLEEDEEKITSMTEELASRQSQVGSMEKEARLFQERLQESQTKLSELTIRFDSRTERAKDLTQRLYSQNERLGKLLERLGFSLTRQGGAMVIQKVPRSERSAQNANDSDPGTSLRRSGTLHGRVIADSADLELLYWMDNSDVEVEADKYEAYMAALGSFDTDAFSEAIYRRVKEVEHMARKLQRDARTYREKAHSLQKEAHDKIAFRHFKEGDLALFLPTRNQTTGAWAAFNVGFPHYFLREQEGHRLRNREWLVARISRIQERVVDLSKSLQQRPGTSKKGSGPGATTETDSLTEEENDNPFDLSDGLRWYLIDAFEDKPGAPSTPGLAKSTVAANNVEAMADMHTHGRSGSRGGGLVGRGGMASAIEGVSKTLSKSLESRRSSTSSKKALPLGIGIARGRDSALASETNSLRAAPPDTPAGTSPTQQHATVHGAARQASPKAASAQVADISVRNDVDRASSDEQHKQHSSPLEAEVRNDLDSLMGP